MLTLHEMQMNVLGTQVSIAEHLLDNWCKYYVYIPYDLGWLFFLPIQMVTYTLYSEAYK